MSGYRWWVVVPLKDTRRAKTRIDIAGRDRRELAIAMAHDTLSAAVACRRVVGVLAVCDRTEDLGEFDLIGVDAIRCRGGGLNVAIMAGIDAVRGSDPDAAIAVLPGDLPYLHGAELGAALVRAEASARTVVGDRAGIGTTLTTAAPGVSMVPRYGAGSLARHRADGLVQLDFPSWSGLRRDVDTLEDMNLAPALGGRTAALLARWAQVRQREETSA